MKFGGIQSIGADSVMSDILSILSGKKNAIENEYVRFDKLSALVIDDIGAMRHAIRSQLQSFGMNNVNVTGEPYEALRLIELHDYDLIVCDYNLNRASSGQHFLEFLRHENLLKAHTVFVMITAEAEYNFVANAVEFAPDDYILKPCPENKFKTRLQRLFDRRTFLMPVLSALDRQAYQTAIEECDRLITLAPNERWAMDVLKRKAEAQIAIGDPDIARTYQLAMSVRAQVPWVTMGVARMHFGQGDLQQAEEIARSLIESNRNYVAAYELLAQICLKRQEELAAYEFLRKASDILPSAKRFRSMSETAYLVGKLDTCKEFTESAIKLSKGSMVERADDYLSLAQVLVDLGEPAEAIQVLEKSAQKHEEAGFYGVSKYAILAQAYCDSGDKEAARKLVDRSHRLLGGRMDSSAMTMLGKAALKVGDRILGLKLLTQAVQSSGVENERIVRHVRKAMIDTGHQDMVDDVVDGGQRRILLLVDEAKKAMRVANFAEAYEKILEAFSIHDENIEALLTAAQLHLLWLKQDGMNNAIADRARSYLALLDHLEPNNSKVMGFYKYFHELTGR